MADRHPYVSGIKAISDTVGHLRNSFPAVVDADTLKKLSIAPKNESYVINILQFLEVIDQEGNKTDQASKVFTLHADSDFQQGFSQMVKDAYSGLFDLHGEKAWELDLDKLISFFRQSDQTSAVVGRRQATTFANLASLAGQRGTSASKPAATAKTKTRSTAKKSAVNDTSSSSTSSPSTPKEKRRPSGRDVGLTVRIEVNLPSDGDQATYDRIFKSLRKHLIDAE